MQPWTLRGCRTACAGWKPREIIKHVRRRHTWGTGRGVCWTRMAARVFTCVLAGRPRGQQRRLPGSLLRPRSTIPRVRHHSAGVISNLIQESLQGVGAFFGEGEREGGGDYTQVRWAWHIPDLGWPVAAGGGRSYPPAGCCLKYKVSGQPL